MEGAQADPALKNVCAKERQEREGKRVAEAMNARKSHITRTTIMGEEFFSPRPSPSLTPLRPQMLPLKKEGLIVMVFTMFGSGMLVLRLKGRNLTFLRK